VVLRVKTKAVACDEGRSAAAELRASRNKDDVSFLNFFLNFQDGTMDADNGPSLAIIGASSIAAG
jgi:hypothetical protein